MARRLLNRMLPFTDQNSWSADKWKRHLLSKAESQSERDDILIMFAE
jgi:hypothetical protein